MAQSLNRRQILGIGATAAAGLAAANARFAFGAGTHPLTPRGAAPPVPNDFDLPVAEIEEIIHAKGTVANGVLDITIARNDIRNVTLRGTPILPSFEINGDVWFQPLGNGHCAMNGDLCLEREEIDPFIDQLLMHNIIFQAEHQHFYDFVPIVFFIHFRAMGDPIQIAKGIKAALNVTSTPFPQAPPKNPKTPLPAAQLGQIIGATPTVGANGVVSMNVPRRNPITLGGIRVNPYLNIAAPVAFEPLGGGMAAAVVDYGMVWDEIQSVMRLMRGKGWDIGCLYNQETDEHPQLFFSHQFKKGDPIELAREIRAGLQLTDSKFMS